MNLHRSIALASTFVAFGLVGLAQAGNNNPPAKKPIRIEFERGLRERVQNAKIDGCGS